jgi:hypothetical protein
LKSFVKEINVDVDTITIDYNLPMPPDTQETVIIGVLPFLPSIAWLAGCRAAPPPGMHEVSFEQLFPNAEQYLRD